MRLLVYGLAVLGLLGSLLHGIGYYREREREEAAAIWRAVNAVRSFQAVFRASDADGNGKNDYWSGDVAGLLTPFAGAPPASYGAEPRALAAADVAPLAPRSGPARPYFGYYVLAVPFDPSVDPDDGGTPDFAICFYPAVYAEGSRTQYTWYVTSGGRFRADTRGVPVRRWLPRKELQMKWGRCC